MPRRSTKLTLSVDHARAAVDVPEDVALGKHDAYRKAFVKDCCAGCAAPARCRTTAASCAHRAPPPRARSLKTAIRVGNDGHVPSYALVHLLLTLQNHAALEWHAHHSLRPEAQPTALDVLQHAALASPCVRVRLLPKDDDVWSFAQRKRAAGDAYTLECGDYVRVSLRAAYELVGTHHWPCERGRKTHRQFVHLHVLLALAIDARPKPLLGPLDWANALLYRKARRLECWLNHYRNAKCTRQAEARQARANMRRSATSALALTPLRPPARAAARLRGAGCEKRCVSAPRHACAAVSVRRVHSVPRRTQRCTGVLCISARRAAASAARTSRGPRRAWTAPW
jgi:hypothetical protein